MSELDRPPLKEVAPSLVATVETLLHEAGETELAAQVGELSIAQRHVERGSCDYTMVLRPDGPWGPDHRTLGLSPGALHIDVFGGKIVCIEILRGPLNFSPDFEIG